MTRLSCTLVTKALHPLYYNFMIVINKVRFDERHYEVVTALDSPNNIFLLLVCPQQENKLVSDIRLDDTSLNQRTLSIVILVNNIRFHTKVKWGERVIKM